MMKRDSLTQRILVADRNSLYLRLIENELHALTGGRYAIVVATRLSTIRRKALEGCALLAIDHTLAAPQQLIALYHRLANVPVLFMGVGTPPAWIGELGLEWMDKSDYQSVPSLLDRLEKTRRI